MNERKYSSQYSTVAPYYSGALFEDQEVDGVWNRFNHKFRINDRGVDQILFSQTFHAFRISPVSFRTACNHFITINYSYS